MSSGIALSNTPLRILRRWVSRFRNGVILEPGNPLLWVSEMNSRRKDGTLVSVGEVIHSEGRSFALNRSDMRITVLSKGQAVEINGCTAG